MMCVSSVEKVHNRHHYQCVSSNKKCVPRILESSSSSSQKYLQCVAYTTKACLLYYCIEQLYKLIVRQKPLYLYLCCRILLDLRDCKRLCEHDFRITALCCNVSEQESTSSPVCCLDKLLSIVNMRQLLRRMLLDMRSQNGRFK